MVVDKLNRDREPGSRPGSANIQTRKTAVIASALRQKLRHRMRMQAFQNDSWADDWGSSKVHMFPELTLGNDEMFKKLSKKFGLDVNMVEHIHNIFRRFDEDGSGEIEYDEFTQMMCDMLGAEHGEVPEKRLRQFWHEIDIDQSHCIEFEEFMVFYVQNFLDPDDPNGSPEPGARMDGQTRSEFLRPSTDLIPWADSSPINQRLAVSGRREIVLLDDPSDLR